MTAAAPAPVRPLCGRVREVPWPACIEAVFAALAQRRGCVWLDSAAGPAELARWSVLAAEPAATLTHGGGVTRLLDPDGRTIMAEAGRPLEALRKALAMFPAEDPPLPFGPGFYGYLAYDLAPTIEPTVGLSPRQDIPLPDLWFGVYEAVLVLDHAARRAYVVGEERAGEAIGQALASAGHAPTANALLFESRLNEAAVTPFIDNAVDRPDSRLPVPGSRCCRLSFNLSRDDFLRAVARARDYIAAGDIFQVNLSRRMTVTRPPAETAAGGFDRALPELYLRLRRANPAPYAAYLGLGAGRAVISSSPELFLECDGRRIVTRPIKGTRPRAPSDEAASARMRQELMASEKDRAELVMIVDLERNDLGRVAEIGSVRVKEPRALEAYAAVYHTVATVEARLRPGADLVDLLAATFPGGSITGAPKVRAMQIIAELEPTCRSVYTGAVGYLGPAPAGGGAGRCRLNIAIRTILAAGPHLHVQVGGGIVADSDPAAEFDETEAKARAVLRALEETATA